MEIQQNQFSPEEIQKNHTVYAERSAVYKSFGFDREEAARKIVHYLFKDHRSILEIGTGRGYLTTILAQFFDRIVSVDIDSNEQNSAGLNAAYHGVLNKIEFVPADAGKLDYPERSFDAVVSAFTFHHLELPFKVISEMIRLADRQIVISDFNLNGFKIVEKVHNYEGRTHGIISGDFDIVGVYLKEHNFNVTVFEYEHQKIYSAVRN
ncbi:MAG: class I SAM-dependent methyltransferase [Spirochaetes bacterium]|nr:class I SAM-dependent methyltransferase [Spirochaetota bacterium]